MADYQVSFYNRTSRPPSPLSSLIIFVLIIKNCLYPSCSVWKPIKGPLNDWPLAVCDTRSVDFQKDTIAGDIVFDDFVTENLQVFPSPQFKWYYLPDHNTWEAIIFKSADSDETSRVPGMFTGLCFFPRCL